MNTLRPDLYNSGITVIADCARVPDLCKIGKNVVIDRHVTDEDYQHTDVPSGETVLKGGIVYE